MKPTMTILILHLPSGRTHVTLEVSGEGVRDSHGMMDVETETAWRKIFQVLPIVYLWMRKNGVEIVLDEKVVDGGQGHTCDISGSP